MDDKINNIRDASIDDMEELKKMGFDISDTEQWNKSWAKTVQDRDSLERLSKIIFIEVPEKLIIRDIKNGLWDFFAGCGVLLT